MADLFDEACDLIDIYEGPEVFLRTFASADLSAALLYAAHSAQSEICNSGFKQFFMNSTGILAPEAVRGLQAMGMPQTAAVVHTAEILFSGPYPRERRLRHEQLRSIDPEKLNELNRKFFALIASENGGFERACKCFLDRVDSVKASDQ